MSNINERFQVFYDCSCGGGCGDKKENNKNASVKVLGVGCKKCNKLEEAVKEALTELGMDSSIDHVTDIMEISKYGVMSTPALVVDGKVVSVGKVLKVKDAVKIISEARK